MKSQDITALLDQLCSIYDQSVANLRKALGAYCEDGAHPDPELRANGCFAYPELRVAYSGERTAGRLTRAFARLTAARQLCLQRRPPGAVPRLPDDAARASRRATTESGVGRPLAAGNPLPYVLDGSGIELGDVTAAELSRWFPTTELAHIGDEIADGVWDIRLSEARPLALFDGLRTDFSLARLAHYTGTPAEHVQQYILFTNYHRYVDEFVRWGSSS